MSPARRTRISALLDPADWPVARGSILRAAGDLGLPEPAVEAAEQHNFCEAEDMLTAAHQATQDRPPVSEVIHLIDVTWPEDAADADLTALVAGALPEDTAWYGTTVAVGEDNR